MEKLRINSDFDGLALELEIVEPKGEPKAIVQISHGMSEHKERYEDFMEYLAENGYVVIINDHRGHGESVKNKDDYGYFYTRNYEAIVDDLHQVTMYAKRRWPYLKVYLFSHSMGTLVSRNYLKKYDSEIEKIVLCGTPTYQSGVSFGIFLAKLFMKIRGEKKPGKFINYLTFHANNKGMKVANEWICYDRAVVDKYNDSQKCGYVFTNNGFYNLFNLQVGAYSKDGWVEKNTGMPVLIIGGEDDPVIISKKKIDHLVSFLKGHGYTNIKYKLYPHMRHEILNEKGHMEVYNDILTFLER